MIMKFKLLISLLLIFSMFVMTACVSDTETAAESDGETLKIGALLPASGVYASLGKNLANGMELYFESVNWEVEGKKIEIVYEDTEVDPQVALRKARKLMDQDKVNILTGPVSTAVAYAIRDEVESKKVPLLVSHAGGNDLTRSKRSDYIWRSSFSSWQIGHSLGQWAYDNVGDKLYIAAADYAFGHEVADAFKEAYESAGGTIVEEVFPPLGNNDYASYLTKMNSADADGVYAFFAGSDAVRFVQQYEQYGLKGKVPLIGSGWLVSEDVRGSQGTSGEGINASIFWDYNLDTPENQEFVKAYEAKYNERPSLESLEGYDAARIIVEAVKSLKGDLSSSDNIVKAISEVSFTSPRGPIQFDQETHHIIQNMYIIETEVKDGKTENKVIETIENVQDPGK
ncbi:ABC transporter substrate-binding protein [Bacillus taeanensis]|uniref:ABC transporter substrate-binding protein n=2 Tax=Bacillus taeanensis TaxID=273032 RepID=A0A366XZA9_9BACI|nr:ABC transporter substrate-binding protein [Bacillus taeanensis]RBW70109.1 ABC transporter substrate-binding protein [Bacillus taeanensis]